MICTYIYIKLSRFDKHFPFSPKKLRDYIIIHFECMWFLFYHMYVFFCLTTSIFSSKQQVFLLWISFEKKSPNLDGSILNTGNIQSHLYTGSRAQLGSFKRGCKYWLFFSKKFSKVCPLSLAADTRLLLVVQKNFKRPPNSWSANRVL